jgi:hypothetical protein
LREIARGEGRIEIEVEASGSVRIARVLDATEDLDGFRRVASSLRVLRASHLRLPSEAQGGWMMLDIEAEGRLPSGRVPGRPVRYPGTLLTFDLSDIGARPLPVVRARILGATWF